MKKRNVKIAVVSSCVMLSALAFALPALAEVQFDGTNGEVMEREAPAEYMTDFEAETEGKTNEIYLTEGQLEELAKDAEEAFDKFSEYFYEPEILDKLEFTYNAEKYDDIRIDLIWEGEYTSKDGTKRPVNFTALFNNDDFPNSPSEISSIHISDGLDIGKLEGFLDESEKALKNQLNMTVPEHYEESSILSVNGKDITLSMFYLDDNSDVYYVSVFDVIDLSANTGEIKTLGKVEEVTQEMVMKKAQSPDYKEFSQEQEAEMLEAASDFLTERGFEYNGLRRSLHIDVDGEEALWLWFVDGANNDVGNIVITENLTITSYAFQQ